MMMGLERNKIKSRPFVVLFFFLAQLASKTKDTHPLYYAAQPSAVLVCRHATLDERQTPLTNFATPRPRPQPLGRLLPMCKLVVLCGTL